MKKLLSIILCMFAALFVCAALFGYAQSAEAQGTEPLEFSVYSDTVLVNNTQRYIADSIFNFVTDKLSFISFDDCNNCDSRAHIISGIIDNHFRLKAAKVWLFTDSKRSSQREKYRTKAEGRLTNKEDCSRWSWHTAPIVIIDHGSGTDTLVIDPSTADGPVSITEWASDLIPEGTKAFVVIKDARYLLFPKDDTGKFEDTKSVWMEENGRVLEDANYRQSIENISDARYGVSEPWISMNFERRIRELLK